MVLDTSASALLFWTLDPAQLSAGAAEAIERADRILVSSIAIWEIGIKVKQGKLEILVSVREYAERLKGSESSSPPPTSIRSVPAGTWPVMTTPDWMAALVLLTTRV